MREAIKQYLQDFAQCVKDDGCVDEFAPCVVGLKYDIEVCEGCKLEQICKLLTEEN